MGKEQVVNLGLNHPDIGLTLEVSALTLSLVQSAHNYLPYEWWSAHSPR